MWDLLRDWLGRIIAGIGVCLFLFMELVLGIPVTRHSLAGGVVYGIIAIGVLCHLLTRDA